MKKDNKKPQKKNIEKLPPKFLAFDIYEGKVYYTTVVTDVNNNPMKDIKSACDEARARRNKKTIAMRGNETIYTLEPINNDQEEHEYEWNG